MGDSSKSSTGLIIYPKDLTICWGDDERYWEWIKLPKERGDLKAVQAPKLREVCWLDVKGKLDMAKLTAGLKYEVWFNVTMKEPVEGWDDCPVTLRLDLPDGTSRSRAVCLTSVPKNKWKLLSVGKFCASGAGQVEFELSEKERLNWKKGLVVKNVMVLPVGVKAEYNQMTALPKPICNHTCSCREKECKKTIVVGGGGGGGGGRGGGGGGGGGGGAGIYQINVQAGGMLIITGSTDLFTK